MIRQVLRHALRRYLFHAAEKLDASNRQFCGATLVFAPHQDDETLGCGGTIIKKRALGAAVGVVFMGDGSSSHSRLMSPHELSCVRRQEALAACETLGVGAENVFFLGHVEGHLQKTYEQALAQVVELIRTWQPVEIYVASARDPNNDHITTNRLVRHAQRCCGSAATIYEYPVWSWWHWPWVGFLSGIRQPSRRVMFDTLRMGMGLRMVTGHRFGLYIGDVLPQKRKALAHHSSQMTRFMATPDWLTLQDISDGEWLACFFQEYEVFQRVVPGPSLSAIEPDQCKMAPER